MKVLHLSSANSWRGGEQQITYLIEGLANLGITNLLFAPKNAPITNFPDGIKVAIHTYRKLSSFNPIVGFQLKNLAQREGVDLIHIHDSHSHNYFLTATTLGLQVPAILSRRVDFPPSSKWKYNHPQIKKIICVSRKIKEIVSEVIENKNKITVIYSGIDLNKRIKPQNSLRKKYQVADNCPVIANISALAEHKDYPTFLATAEEYIHRYNDHIQFFIIGGDAGEKENIQSIIQSSGLQKNITLTGYLPDAHQYLSEIDVFLFTSKEEGLGTTLLDAMLYNTPIISTAAGGIPEIIQDGKNGLLCNIGDHNCLAQNIYHVLHTKTLRDNIIRSGVTKVKSFSKESMTEKTLEVYKSVLKSA